MATQQQEQYADKITKLLRKAESTDSVHEAEALFQKAQELMTEYAITEAMLNEARGSHAVKDEFITEEFVHTGSFRVALGNVTWQAMLNNNIKAVLIQDSPRVIDGKERKQTYILKATGFKSDMDRFRALCASLQLQAVRAGTRWWNEHREANTYAYLDPKRAERQLFLDRRQFISSFGDGVGAKMREATRAGREAAERAAAERSKTSMEIAKHSVELVLQSREVLLVDEFKRLYPHLRSVSQRQNSGSSASANAGYAAGRNADVGQPGLGGNRRGLNR
jgi:hypothetical protein